jgi:hypothetical protein
MNLMMKRTTDGGYKTRLVLEEQAGVSEKR